MTQHKPTALKSALVVFTAGAFFFYSFIQMTLFSTEAMKSFFMDLLSLKSAAEFGNFAGMFLYGTVLLLIPIGLILDKFSAKKVIITTLIIEIICVFGMAVTKDVVIASILRFITGIAHCVAFMSPFRLAPRWFGSKQLALVSGLLVAFAVFGGWVSGNPMLTIVNSMGGQSAMMINGGLGVVILVLSLLFLKDFPLGYKHAESGEGGLSLMQGLKLAARNKQNWLGGLYIGFLNLAVLLLGAMWGTTYLKIVNPEFSEATFTGIIGMIFIGTIIGSPLSGWISDKLKSRKKAMIGGGVLSLIAMMLIIFPPSTSAGFFYFIFLLLGLITAAQSIGYPVIAESNDDEVLGTANGLSSVLLMGMGAIGQPLFGYLVAAFGGGEGAAESMIQTAFERAIWVMPIAFVLAIVCALLLRETFKKEE